MPTAWPCGFDLDRRFAKNGAGSVCLDLGLGLRPDYSRAILRATLRENWVPFPFDYQSVIRYWLPTHQLARVKKQPGAGPGEELFMSCTLTHTSTIRVSISHDLPAYRTRCIDWDVVFLRFFTI